MVEVVGIMAASRDGAIGLKGGLPWTCPDETRHFRSVTDGHTIIMGRKTFEATPHSLYDTRAPWVFTRQRRLDGIEDTALVHTVEDIRHRLSKLDADRVYMIGGAETAHACLRAGLITSFILTRMREPCDGDTYLDLAVLRGWSEETLAQHEAYSIVRLMP